MRPVPSLPHGRSASATAHRPVAAYARAIATRSAPLGCVSKIEWNQPGGSGSASALLGEAPEQRLHRLRVVASPAAPPSRPRPRSGASPSSAAATRAGCSTTMTSSASGTASGSPSPPRRRVDERDDERRRDDEERQPADATWRCGRARGGRARARATTRTSSRGNPSVERVPQHDAARVAEPERVRVRVARPLVDLLDAHRDVAAGPAVGEPVGVGADLRRRRLEARVQVRPERTRSRARAPTNGDARRRPPGRAQRAARAP